MCVRWPDRCAATAISCCAGTRYPFRVSSGQTPDGTGTRVHLNLDPGARALVRRSRRRAGLRGARAALRRRVDAAPRRPDQKAGGDAPRTPWRITAKVKADPAAARFEQLEVSYGTEEPRCSLPAQASPLRRLAAAACRALGRAARCRQVGRQGRQPSRSRLLPAVRALLSGFRNRRFRRRSSSATEQIMLGGRPLQNVAVESARPTANPGRVDRLDFRAPGHDPGVAERRASAGPAADSFKAALSVEFLRSGCADGLAAGPQRGRPIAARSRCGCAATSAWRRTASRSTP